MKATAKIDIGQKHILTLIQRDSGPDGWTPVSKALFPTVSKAIPTSLAVFEELEEGGRARLTEEGTIVLKWI